MGPLQSPQDYLFNLHSTNSSEAKRLWRKQIKESWNCRCAYCDSEENLTLDHIIPRSKGGLDISSNIVCCCHECNFDKSHTDWIEWFKNQDFYSEEKEIKIKDWMKPKQNNNLYRYRPRKNMGLTG